MLQVMYITLTPKPYMDKQKIKLKTNFLTNRDTKILNKLFANQFEKTLVTRLI